MLDRTLNMSLNKLTINYSFDTGGLAVPGSLFPDKIWNLTSLLENVLYLPLRSRDLKLSVSKIEVNFYIPALHLVDRTITHANFITGH